MFPVVYVVAVGAHELCQSQSRGKLSKLGGLQTQRSDDQPRVGAFNIVRIEDGGKEQE